MFTFNILKVRLSSAYEWNEFVLSGNVTCLGSLCRTETAEVPMNI